MIKKVVFSVLCNRAVGSIILWAFRTRIPALRWSGYSFNVSPREMPKRIIASIFWGFYESAEIRLLNKYFKGDSDVIECGASSGIVSAFIVSKFKDQRLRYIGVETNDRLRDLWTLNTSRHNRLSNTARLINAAVYYDATWAPFNISDNPTSSSLDETVTSHLQNRVRAIRLSDLVRDEMIDSFTLVSDIEGGEAAILVHEDLIFTSCKGIFIELHDTWYQGKLYQVGDLRRMIELRAFRVIENIGNVFYFERFEQRI